MRFRQALAASSIKQKFTLNCRVVNIDVRHDQHSESDFKKSPDIYSKTPTSKSVWGANCIEHLSLGVLRCTSFMREQ